ncbi:UDP-N-acetylmuramate dehydrogenase [Patescibacteria group bacterium]|nr:UDP-N-acetylmuramate dehydrogenase [Patescibacteria group bacterium]
MQLQDNYSLKNVTTLGIGGPAKKFVEVLTQEELIKTIKYAKSQNLEYLVIGGGSNLLVSDQGTDCLVIRNKISGIAQNDVISVKSGTPLQELVDYSIQNNLSGLQKLTGIPGTLGGAIYGNAGAYGQSISDRITQVTVLNPSNLTIEQFNNSDCQFNYRDSIFKRNKFIILETKFHLEKGDKNTLQTETKEVIWKRFVKYPPGIKSPGSFFKNIVASTLPKEVLAKIPAEKIVYGKLPAGTLLEEVGAKGQSLDGIEIASYHANLFINKDNGTAQAFYNLAKQYAQKVKEKFGIILVPEVQLINLPPLI